MYYIINYGRINNFVALECIDLQGHGNSKFTGISSGDFSIAEHPSPTKIKLQIFWPKCGFALPPLPSHPNYALLSIVAMPLD